MQRRIRIQDATGRNLHTAEVPADVPTKELLPSLVSKLGLPADADGRPIRYSLYHEHRQIASQYTLDSAGIEEDATLTIVREAIAACFPAGTQITLADGTECSIERIKPGDLVLSYNIRQNRTEAGTVERILTDSAEKYLVVNDALQVTESHLIYVGEDWRPARDLAAGDMLVTRSGKRIAVADVRHEVQRGLVYNLHLSSQKSHLLCGRDSGPQREPKARLCFCHLDETHRLCF